MSNDEIALRELCANIPGPSAAASAAARTRLDRLTKPPGSLGALEPLIVRLAAITGQVRPEFSRPAVLVAAGDHGVVAERVSAYPQSVTGQMMLNFLRGGAAINALAANAGARVVVVDAGVAADLPDHPGLRRASAGRGTRNLLREPAMTRAQASGALLAGARIVAAECAAGLDLLALGEMGIGNTTAAAAVAAALGDGDSDDWVGRGTGVDDDGLARKQAAVRAAVGRIAGVTDPLEVLRQVGGAELVAMAAACVAARHRELPVVLDGYVVTASVLPLTALRPDALAHCIAGHCSAEPGHRKVLARLGLSPLLDLGMRLGEGSGAMAAVPLVAMACAGVTEVPTFGEWFG